MHDPDAQSATRRSGKPPPAAPLLAADHGRPKPPRPRRRRKLRRCCARCQKLASWPRGREALTRRAAECQVFKSLNKSKAPGGASAFPPFPPNPLPKLRPLTKPRPPLSIPQPFTGLKEERARVEQRGRWRACLRACTCLRVLLWSA